VSGSHGPKLNRKRKGIDRRCARGKSRSRSRERKRDEKWRVERRREQERVKEAVRGIGEKKNDEFNVAQVGLVTSLVAAIFT
jgi:hypothetical protein